MKSKKKKVCEFKREETSKGSYSPTQFFELLNNYSKEGWELVWYNEIKNDYSQYIFIVVLKRIKLVDQINEK